MGLIGIIVGLIGAAIGMVVGLLGGLLGVALGLIGGLLGLLPVLFPIVLIALGVIWLAKSSNSHDGAEVRPNTVAAAAHSSRNSR